VGQRAFTVDTSSDDSAADKIIEAKSNPEDVIAVQEEAASKENSSLREFAESNHKDLLLTLVSRRSIKRAGLRYLRRGIDADGNVANSVETEQILSNSSWDAMTSTVYSFVQYRGSIPLFFSQSPYSLKPVPVLSGSDERNNAAFKSHFAHLLKRYGSVQAVSLVDTHGGEATIGQAYEKHAKSLNKNGGIDGKDTALNFNWFDFHGVCRGMKFEKVSVLIDELQLFLSSASWTAQKANGLESTQSGVLRTNCMDCLDRTNVVQSAVARWALEQQLAQQGIKIDLQNDPTTAWFNSLWADNGDAISRQYAGTAALKGDYTRTRKRNLGGALTDFGLTLSRYYNNIVNDYFAQALIDFLLGRATDSIFAEFEADMKSQDYAIDMRKVRQNAIDVCEKIVVEDEHEDLVAGWTLSCPAQSNTLRSLPFEECVLLLTGRSLYFCRFDWGTEKVREFERLELATLESLERGAYITSTLAQRHMDEKKNVGFVVRYKNQGTDLRRINTRSLDSEKKTNDEEKRPDQEDAKDKEKQKAADEKKQQDSSMRFLAFKALPPANSVASKDRDGHEEKPPSEDEAIRIVCEEIARVTNTYRNGAKAGEKVDPEDQGADDERLVVREKDVISVAEAKRSTGYLEQIGYSLKKLVWS